MRPRYLWTTFMLIKGSALLALLPFLGTDAGAALWCGAGSLLIGVPLMGAAETLLARS